MQLLCIHRQAIVLVKTQGENEMYDLEIAKMIASKVDSKEQNEIEAMIEIACEMNDLDFNSMYKAVSNMYAKHYMKRTAKTDYIQSEADAR